MLAVVREQLPLAPYFAITAHAAQGQTLQAAIVDLQIGRGVSIVASYIALTRVRSREDIIIYRAFDRDLFAAGAPLVPELLLRVLRGEAIDWAALEAKYVPQRICVCCRELLFKDSFTGLQFKKAEPMCKGCINKKRVVGTPIPVRPL